MTYECADYPFTTGGIDMNDAVATPGNANGSSPADFWETFQLSPNHLENAVMSRVHWAALITTGPLLLLILESTLISVYHYGEISWSLALRDLLGDPIFSFVTLAFFLGAMVFVHNWYPEIQPAFQSLLDNNLLSDRHEKSVHDSYRAFLGKYQDRLHSRKRYLVAAGFVTALLLTSYIILSGRSVTFADVIPRSGDPLLLLIFLHFATRWIITGFVWGFFGGVAVRAIWITNHTIRQLTSHFRLRIQPSHSDKAGGLRQLGDLCSSVGIVIIVASIPLAFFGIRGTTTIVESRRCLREIESAAYLDDLMEKKELVNCLDAINRATRGALPYTSDEANATIQEWWDDGYSPSDIVRKFAGELAQEADDGIPLSDDIIALNRTSFALLIGLVFISVLGMLVVAWPLWDIHGSMVRQRQRHEAKLNTLAVSLHETLSRQIENQHWEDAQKTRDYLKMVRETLPDAINYPTWPISYPRLLRRFLAPSILSAALSYGLTYVKAVFSEESKRLFEELIKAIGAD
jgi:hypothetical protein